MRQLYCKFAPSKQQGVNAISLVGHHPGWKRILFLFLAILSFTQVLISQFQPTPVVRSKNRVTVSGKNFYLHEVLKGQTLYGITKAYEVTEDEIKKENPDLNKKSVFPGMVLRIPDNTSRTAGMSAAKGIRYVEHTVKPKENLYSIARDLGVRPDEIRDLNPDLKGGLKTGQVILVPATKGVAPAEVKPAAPATEKQQPVEPVTDIAGDPGDLPCKAKPSAHTAEEFRIAMLLPLNLSQNDTLIITDTLKTEYFRFYEFLEGAYLAVDSLRLAGMNITMEVFDTERDPLSVRRIIESGKLNDADLIIGPVFPNEIEPVSAFSAARRIPMVSPLSTFDLTRTNPYAFQVRNKLARQIELAGAYLGTKYKQNVVVIGRLAEKKSPEFIRFTGILGTQLKEHDPAGKATFKTVYYSESGRDFFKADSVKTQIANYLSGTLPNYIIVTSENEVFITEVINELYKISATSNIHVYGLSQWAYTELDPGNLYSVGLEATSDFQDDNVFIDFSDPRVMQFCGKYKANWNIEPSKYSFQGFDVTYLFCNALFRFGRNIIPSVPCWPEYIGGSCMMTAMRFRASGGDSGFTNHAITIVSYEKDELTRKKVN